MEKDISNPMYSTLNFAFMQVLLKPFFIIGVTGLFLMELYSFRVFGKFGQFKDSESQCSKSVAQIHQKKF